MSYIQYSGYNFPPPLPQLAESCSPVIISGVYDYSEVNLELIGFLTGANLSGLHLQKQQMSSGLLSEYGDLNISIGADNKVFKKVKPVGINFSDSDLTTILPYSVSFTAYTGESFSSFFGIASPKNEWSFEEQENKIVQATHTISANGKKVDEQTPLQNAIDFVNSLTGFYNASVFFTGHNAFLRSRSEKINRKTSSYEITEVYVFDSSDNLTTTSGIVSYDTTINFSKDGSFAANIKGSIQGGINGEQVNTGVFTPQDATNALFNDVVGSMSQYETGCYSFIRNGPSNYSYNHNTGANTIDFDFVFLNLDNIDQSGNIAHSFKTNISASKDAATFVVSAEGELYFNSIESAINTGEYESSTRFQEVDAAFSGIDPFNIAYRGWLDFRSGNSDFITGTSGTLSSVIKASNVNKDPVTCRISYNFQFDTAIDYSSGTLKDLQMSIVDKVPLQLSNVTETLGGFAAQTVSDRTLGEYSISSSAQETTGKMSDLKRIVSGFMSGDYDQSNNESFGVDNISFNLSKFY